MFDTTVLGIIMFLSLHIELLDKIVSIRRNLELELGCSARHCSAPLGTTRHHSAPLWLRLWLWLGMTLASLALVGTALALAPAVA